MCNFLIGGKTGVIRSLAAHLFDRNSLGPGPLPVRCFHSIPPCVVRAGSSSNLRNHFNLHSNERI
jgi:hypothetical protein